MAQFQIECVESSTDKDRSQYGKFILEPLDRGQGTTVGNALMRSGALCCRIWKERL